MKKVLLAALLFAPLAARADVGLRLGVDASLLYHDAAGTHAITDSWPLGGDVMLSYWLPASIISFDLELAEQFLGSAPLNAGSRRGTVFRPGIRIAPPILPIYVRGAIPINFEQPDPYKRELFDLRLGAGIRIPLVLLGIYAEGDVDFPLGGGDNSPGAFNTWEFSLTGGVDFKF